MEDKKAALDTEYRNIRGTLSHEGLLRERPSRRFSSPAVQTQVKRRTDAFASMLGIDYADTLYEACERNTLVYAKVMLSLYRRANEVYHFHEEGRVQPVK